jgi:hypothetical protein
MLRGEKAWGGKMKAGGRSGKMYYHVLEYGDYGNIGYQGVYDTLNEAEKEAARLKDYFPKMDFQIFPSNSMKEPPITTMAKGGKMVKGGGVGEIKAYETKTGRLKKDMFGKILFIMPDGSQKYFSSMDWAKDYWLKNKGKSGSSKMAKGGKMKFGGVTKNEEVIESFLTESEEVGTKNLSTQYKDGKVYLKNYETIIATRQGNNIKLNPKKYSNTTTKITNKLESLASGLGLKVEKTMELKKGGALKPIPKDNKGLPNLPEKVRNNMGYMEKGGKMEMGGEMEIKQVKWIYPIGGIIL